MSRAEERRESFDRDLGVGATIRIKPAAVGNEDRRYDVVGFNRTSTTKQIAAVQIRADDEIEGQWIPLDSLRADAEAGKLWIETPASPHAESRPLRLTNLGRIAARYSVLTRPEFWVAARREIARVAERDGDWEVLVEERIAGLRALRSAIRNHGPDWLRELEDEADALRPEPGWEPPPGYRLEPVEEGKDWRVVEETETLRCRYVIGPGKKQCQAWAAGAVERGSKRVSWWGYCAEHLWGRWIEDRKVYFWRAVPIEPEGDDE